MSVPCAWHHDPVTLRFLVFRYIPSFFVLSLAWEAVHVRLYTLWTEETSLYIALSVVHCTFGDVLIGLSALLLALVAGREQGPGHWNAIRIALLGAVFGTAYTVWSEFMNVALRRTWTYAESMPRIPLGDFELGLSPFLQWLLIPPLAMYASLRLERARASGGRCP